MQRCFSTLAKGLDQPDPLKRHLSLCLRTCAEKKCLIDGRVCHDDAIQAGHDRDVYLSSLIFDLYSKCGAIYDAKSWFSMMEERSVFSWNCLISMHVRCMHSIESVHCFEQMQQECIIPNSATFANVVAACANREFFIQGMWIHARSQHTDLEACVVVQTALISMYNKCGKHKNAHEVFEAMKEKDVVSWNAMLSSFIAQGDSKSAIQLFAQMEMECVMQDKYTYATMFSACSSEGALKKGSHLHSCVLKSGFEINNVMSLALINMYGKCGSMSNAREVFDASSKQDLAIWNAFITELTGEGDGSEVIQVFGRLLEEALMPDRVTFLSALADCASQGAAWQGRQLHIRLLATNLKSDIQVETALVHMYGKLGITTDANLVFKNMLKHDTVSWNALISILSQHGLTISSFQNFQQMQQEGLMPNKITLTSVIYGCMDSVSLSHGKHLHALVISSGLLRDVFTGNALINMYCKWGMIDDAHELFDTMVFQDIISWNSLIAGYAQIGNTEAALALFNRMCEQEIRPDQATYCSILSVMASEVQPVVASKGLNTSTLSTKVRIEENIRVFEIRRKEQSHNKSLLRSSIVGSNAEFANGEEEFQLFAKRDVTNSAYGDHSNQKIIEGMLVHSHILVNGLDKDAVIHKALLRFYGKCGSLTDCKCIFDKDFRGDVIAWNLMISAYILRGHDKEAIQLFDQMQKEGTVIDNVSFLNVIDACANVPFLFHGRRIHIQAILYGFDLDMTVGTSLVKLYAKCGSLAEARWLFDHLSERDVVAWTSIISVYVQLEDGEEALNLFWKMQFEGITPDVVSFTSAVNASELQSTLFGGKLLYTCITQHKLESDSSVIIALVYMYGKCGSLFDADFVFSQVLEPSLDLWNAIIASYAQHGDGSKVFLLLFSMMEQGLIPNNMTLVSVLSACSRAGLVEEAYACLSSASGFLPMVEHYDCMVDLLGRAGQFYEAEHLLKRMPFVPTVVSWASFGTCHQTNRERVELAMAHMIEMDPVNSASYVTLSNIYAVAEESDDVGKCEQQDDSLEAGYGMSI
ncbi:hypothetical protein GOP47_0008984 [Adiantum capillus-veneris]|uniref:Pentatricopeptide repeat-containing protein n=1 Tax=Adiantum capillus-veneris TaxID=13818 RepID=A0A9D4UZM7_ADICA|nr:hypothetical protein GOP47_0008984 [Adiantum capillus-veneris]